MATSGTTVTGAAAPTATTSALLSSSSTATPSTPSSMNFRQMQELVAKWTSALDEQEKDFIDAATKVNYWDKALMANMEKISKMSESMEKVKAEHERMENALDLIKNYQKDFENFLETLEGNTPQPPAAIDAGAASNERSEFYTNVSRVHTDLQQISGDLKTVIRDINVSNKLLDKNDPMSQILRILNEHTDTLQWLDDQSVQIKENLEEVSKLHQFFRRDQERSLRLMFKPNE